LLPMGRLREPVSSLARCDAVVLTNDTSSKELPLAKQLVWRVQRGIVAPERKDACVAFCGIARPQVFFDQLQAACVVLVGTLRFRDHHSYSASDVRQLMELRTRCGATAFVTTEKDAINVGQHLGTLEPVYVVPVGMQLEDSDAAVEALLAAIRERNRQPA